MPHKIFINGQDDPDIKHFCQKSGLESTREPKLVVVIDKAPIYLEPNLEQGYAAIPDAERTTLSESVSILGATNFC